MSWSGLWGFSPAEVPKTCPLCLLGRWGLTQRGQKVTCLGNHISPERGKRSYLLLSPSCSRFSPFIYWELSSITPKKMGGSRRGADLGMWTGVYIHDYAIKQPNFQYLNWFSSSRYIYCLLLPWKTKDSRFPLHYKPGVELRPLVGLAVLLCGLSLLWLPLSLQEPRKIFLTHPAHNKHPGWHFALARMSQMAGVGWGQVPRGLNEGCGEKLLKSLMSPQVGANLTCGLLELKAAAGGGTSPPSTIGDKPL